MNSINFFKKLGLSMVAGLAIYSCVKEDMEPMANDSQDLMTISLSAGIQTKTTMTPGVPKLSWTEGDKFDLFSNGGDAKTTPEYTSDDAVIEAGVNQGATEVYAVYPALAANKKSSVTVTIPAAQTQAVAGKMNGNNVPMYAQGTIVDGAAVLSFKPVAGIIALNIYSTEATEAKVAKVQVNPLDAEGNFIYSGYCGTVTTSADEFSYEPTQEVNGVTLTLGAPCEIASERPADNAATLNFANQLYIAVARGTYAGLQFIITTDDGKMYVAKTTTARSFEQTDVHYLNINLAGKDEISDDFYGQYNAGLDLTICGNVINKKTHPKAKCIMSNASDMWTVLEADYTDETNGGVLFIDNTASSNYKATTSSKTFGKDKIIIGRYRSANQAVLRITANNDKAGTAQNFRLAGGLMVKNMTISTFIATQPLFGCTSANGTAEIYFEDCTLTKTGDKYGIFYANSTNPIAPKSIRFDNCIVRASTDFFGADTKSGTSTYMEAYQSLESLTFNNCVFAPATGTTAFSESVTRLTKTGVLVALYNQTYDFSNLDITLSYCSFYELGTGTSKGVIDVSKIGTVAVDHCIFYNSAATGMLVNSVAECPETTSVTMSATYSNVTMSLGSKTNITKNGGEYSGGFTIWTDTPLFDTPQAQIHYFPKSASFTKIGGASYDTKYWIVPAAN